MTVNLLMSRSAVKEAAVNFFLEKEVRQKDKVITCESKSYVNEQPYGYEEIMRGCFARYSNWLGHSIYTNKESERTIIFAAENGFIKEDAGYADVCMTLIGDANTGLVAYGWSTPIPLPTDAVEEAIKRGLATTTVGMVLKEWGRVSNDKNFTAELGFIGREMQIYEALCRSYKTQ